MPSVSATDLAAPLYALRDQLGPGWPAQDSATPLDQAQAALSDVAAGLDRAWACTADGWSGRAAAAAARFTAGTVAQAAELAGRARLLGAGVRAAGDTVARARTRLEAIIEQFERHVAALAGHLGDPGVAEELRGAAQRAISAASAVVEELRVDLEHQAVALTAPAAGSPPAAGKHFGAAMPGPIGLSALPGLARLAGLAGPARPAGAMVPAAGADRAESAVGRRRDPGMFGDGVAVRLPDGSSALAPNAVAADAVRHALTQLGVPYRWGGTTPGVGLDCSGLTQWAYHEAGLDIPRLAQEQDIGQAVSADALRPGDLAVWDGHVAMIVGDATMIEAGDPVKLSPIRTTNAGQGFQGFWRPTA